jgi:cysteinyl-tRNA synthetase
MIARSETEQMKAGGLWLAALVILGSALLTAGGCSSGGGGGGGGDGGAMNDNGAEPGTLSAEIGASTATGSVGGGLGNATAGETVTLGADISGGTQPYSYDWWVNDGPNGSDDPEILDSEAAQPTVTFTEAGVYTIGLIVTDADDAEVEQFYSIEVIAEGEEPTNPLAGVRFWAYQIGGLENDGAIEPLVESRYDLYVLEPTRSDRENADFDTAGMVQRLHASEGSSPGRSKLAVAYIDIGEAEDWRTYWLADWVAPSGGERGNPDFLITADPDGWSGNYPVAYWDDRWKDIIIYGEDSVLQQVLDDGFDGIYMDWVEGYSDETVAAAAAADGLDPAEEMIQFIREIRDYARAQDPDFLIIPQNAAEILEVGGQGYLDLIDAIAQEQIYFDGDADTEWDAPRAGDVPVPEVCEEGDEDCGYSREFYEGWLEQYRGAGKVVLSVDYAAEPANVSEAYENAAANGYIPYVSQRPLDRLTDTPPPGLPE